MPKEEKKSRLETSFIRELLLLIKPGNENNVLAYINSKRSKIPNITDLFNQRYHGSVPGVSEFTPFQLARRIGSLPIIRVLLDLGGVPDFSCLKGLFQQEKNIDIINAIISCRGVTLTHECYDYAIQNSAQSIFLVNILLEKGIIPIKSTLRDILTNTSLPEQIIYNLFARRHVNFNFHCIEILLKRTNGIDFVCSLLSRGIPPTRDAVMYVLQYGNTQLFNAIILSRIQLEPEFYNSAVQNKNCANEFIDILLQNKVIPDASFCAKYVFEQGNPERLQKFLAVGMQLLPEYYLNSILNENYSIQFVRQLLSKNIQPDVNSCLKTIFEFGDLNILRIFDDFLSGKLPQNPEYFQHAVTNRKYGYKLLDFLISTKKILLNDELLLIVLNTAIKNKTTAVIQPLIVNNKIQISPNFLLSVLVSRNYPLFVFLIPIINNIHLANPIDQDLFFRIITTDNLRHSLISTFLNKITFIPTELVTRILGYIRTCINKYETIQDLRIQIDSYEKTISDFEYHSNLADQWTRVNNQCWNSRESETENPHRQELTNSCENISVIKQTLPALKDKMQKIDNLLKIEELFKARIMESRPDPLKPTHISTSFDPNM